MKKIKESNIINLGLDYLEVKGTSKKFESLIFPNNMEEGEYILSDLFPNYKIKKTYKVMSYEYKIIFHLNGYDCFAYQKGKKLGKISSKDFIGVYGTAFKVFKNIKSIFEFIIDNIEGVKIKRFDIAIDIQGCSVSDIYKSINDNRKKKGSIFFDGKGKMQTFYLGEKKRSINKYKLLRCYNKIDDIIAKERQPLYADYLSTPPITRIEFEFRSEVTKDTTIFDFYNHYGDKKIDNNYIYGLFLTYISDYTDIFSKFKFKKIKLSRLNKKIDIEELKTNSKVKAKYLLSFLGYSRTLLSIGSCPVKILLENDVISNKTKEDISFSIEGIDFDINKLQKRILKRESIERKVNNGFLSYQENE